MNILFDLDGTLTDPRHGFVASIKHALTSLGHAAAPEDEIAGHIGPPLQETLSTLLGENHLHEVEAAISLYRERYTSLGIFECSVYDGIPQALDSLRSSGARLLVATSKPHVYAHRILDHFGLSKAFYAVYGSELDGTRTDKRHLVSYLLQRESIPAASALMIGDRAQDVSAAKANGLPSVGVLWGYGSREELETAGASAVLTDPDGLVNLLSSNSLFQGVSCFTGEHRV